MSTSLMPAESPVAKSSSEAASACECCQSRFTRWISLALQIGVSAILAQTLYFKFTYAPETQLIFGSLGGRPAATFAGLVELVCVVLLLTPRAAVYGAALALATISGALLTHVFLLGLVIVDPQTGQGDGGLLFALALAVFCASAAILWLRRSEWPRFLTR